MKICPQRCVAELVAGWAHCALCAGSMPPNHFSDASAAFPSQYSEPPTSDDMAYVPMSSFGPESSLAPATTSDRGELNYMYAEPSRLDPAFPSPFAVSPGPVARHAAPSIVSCVEMRLMLLPSVFVSIHCLRFDRHSCQASLYLGLKGLSCAIELKIPFQYSQTFEYLFSQCLSATQNGNPHAGLIWNSS